MALAIVLLAVLCRYGCSWSPWPLPSRRFSHAQLPPQPSVVSRSSSLRWLAFPAPSERGGFDRWSAVVEVRDASFTAGRLQLHGLSAADELDARQHLQPYRHYEQGVGYRFDSLADVVSFEPLPLNLSSCSAVQQRTAALLSPYLPGYVSHWMMDTLVSLFAVLRLAHALPASAAEPAVLYVVQRYTSLPELTGAGAAAMGELLPALFDGDVRDFAELQNETAVLCFRRLLWGRGPLLYRLPSLRALEREEAERAVPLRPLPASPHAFAELQSSEPAEARLLSAAPWRDTAVAFSRWVFEHYHHSPSRQRSSQRQCGGNDGGNEDGSGLRVLFIARPPASRGGRFVSNVELLQRAFAAHRPWLSLSLCCDWSRPLSEHLRLFEAADAMVGLHGAGLLNALFMPAGGAVVELAGQHGYGMAWYELISERAGHRYVQLDARPLQQGNERGHVLDAAFAELVVHTVLDVACTPS